MSRKSRIGVLLLITGLLAACGGSEPPATEMKKAPPAQGAETAAPAEKTSQGKRVDDRIEVPDWFPADIYLPADFQATQALSMTGTPNRTLRGITQQSTAALLDTYYEELATAGYRVTPREEMKEENAIRFHQNGIETGVLRVKDDGDRRELQFLLMFPGS